MASSASIELLLERSEALRPLRDMVIAPKKMCFGIPKIDLEAIQQQILLRQPLKPTGCNLALFFIFFRFCAELNFWACLWPSPRQQGVDIDRKITFAFELGSSQRSFTDSHLGAGLVAWLTRQSF
jgi:hypothetical protein